MKKCVAFVLLIVLAAFSTAVQAQVSITAGDVITQGFSIGASENAVLPANWRIDKVGSVRTVGTYDAAQNNTERRGGNNMGVMSTSGIYNFGAGDAASAADRALGWLSSTGATQSGNLYTCLKNTGTEGIYSFTISYNIEKYKKGSNNAGFTIQMYYSFDGETWQSAGNDFRTAFGHDGFDNSGYNNAPGLTVNVHDKLLSVSVNAGDSIYLAWNYSVSSGTSTGFAQALGIDDVAIQANFFPPSYDAAVTEWLNPTDKCNLTASETVSIKVMNMGIEPLTSFQLSYSIDGGTTFITPETYTGQVLPGNDITYTFTATANFSSVGIYNCVFAVALATDQNNSNDTLQKTIVHVPDINTFPYFDNFETFNGWTTPGNLWQHGIPAQQGISSARSGMRAWMTGLSSNYPNNAEEYLYSPCYDFSGLTAPIFSAWLNINIPDLGNDAMILEYSTDGGSIWQKVSGIQGFYNYTGSTGSLPSPKWTGNTGGWQLFETPLTGLAGQANVRLRFKFVSNATSNGEGIAIDDITIRDPFNTDLAIVHWLEPSHGCGLSDTTSITIQIVNVGANTVLQFPVTYSIDGGITYITDEIVNMTLAPGDTIDYTFTTLADFSTPNAYYCIAKLNLTTDENPGNDTYNKTIYSIPYVTAYPYNEDFEMSFTGWQSEAVSGANQWEIGPPNQTALNSAFSGNRAWMTRLSYNYNNSSVSILTSPCYDFTNLTDPYFSAMLNIRTEVGYDAMILEQSTDGGVTWSKVTGDAGFYTDNSMFGNVAPPKWSGNNNGWNKYETSLPHLAGESIVRFRFVFTSNASNNDEGIAIDDVIVRDKYENDLSVVDWVIPYGGCGLSTTETVAVKVANLGKNSQTGFDIGFSLNGGTFSFETFSGLINPGDTITYIFTATGDFSIPMDYSCMAVVNLATDENTINDAFFTMITSIPYITTYPYFQNFEMGRAGWSSETISGNNQWDYGMPQQTVVNFPKSGIHCWMTGLDNDYDNNSNSYLISPCLDFTTLSNPQISVWLNMKIIDEGNDAMILESSIDGGFTWTKVAGGTNLYNFIDTVGTMDSPKWSGTTSGWQEFKSPLTGLAGQNNVKLRFRFESNEIDVDEGIAIDDIMIHDPFSNDIAVLEWISPRSECNMTANEYVTIKIANLGTVAQSGFQLAFSTDGGMTFSPASTYPTVLNPGDTVAYIFPVTADFSIPGEYNCVATVSLATEQNPNNDIAFAKVYSVPTFNTFPYFDDYESYYSGWTSIALQGVDQWEKGTPNQHVLSYAHSGSQAYMTKLHARYNNNSNSVLLSPCLNMSTVSNPKLSVWLNMKTEPGYDAMILEKSLNGGNTWSKLDGDAGFYNNSSTDGPINNPPKWSGNSNGWTNFVTAAPSLVNQSNVRLRFRFASDLTGNDEGIVVDDFLLYQPVVNDLGVTSVLTPESSVCGSFNDSIFIEITNFGTNYQTQIPVKVDILTPSTVMINKYDTIITNLAPGASAVFFIDTVTTVESGTYYIFASTEHPADTINHFNNLTTSNFYVKNPLPLPYVEDFEGVNIEWIGSNIEIGQDHGSSSNVLYAELNSINTQAEANSTKIGPLTSLSRVKFDYRIVTPTGAPYTMQSGDALQIFITNDCYTNSYMLFEINETNHVPSATKKPVTFDLASFDGDVVFLSFKYLGSGNSFFADIDNIIFANAPQVYLGSDTSLCTGTITLNAATALQNSVFYWRELSLPDTISTAPTLLVTQSGYYHVSVDNGYGMTASDSIEIFINPLPDFSLGPDIYICTGLSVDLTASGGVSYIWNTGATTASITVTPTTVTNYSVTVTDNNGCSASDDLNVVTYALPTVNLGQNQTLCGDGSVTLNAGSNYIAYLWSTGATTQYITVDTTGIGYGSFVYTVTVTNTNNCSGSGSITITFENCTGLEDIKHALYEIFPNPSDGTFNITALGNVSDKLQLHIYNAQAKLVRIYSFDNVHHNFVGNLDLKHLGKGVYFVKLVNNNNVQMRKIIIQ